MKGLLLGTDFMYDKEGKLKPIQINTALSINNTDRIEDLYTSVFDFSHIENLILENNIKKIAYVGGMFELDNLFKILCEKLNLDYEFYEVNPPLLTVPHIEDNSDILIVRSGYDMSAIIDYEYCRSRTNFLELIKDYDIGTEFSCFDEKGFINNNLIAIPNNGEHPNYILKSSYPDYDRETIPRLFKVSNMGELNKIMRNVDLNLFITPFYFNGNKLYDDYIINIRSMNLMLSPDLKTIPVGVFTKRCKNKCNITPKYDENFEILSEFKSSYLTTDDYKTNELRKDYIKNRIVTDEQIKEMNDIVKQIGNIILENY